MTYGHSDLINAAAEGDLKKLQKIAETHSYLFAQEAEPLNQAAGHGHIDVLKYLLTFYPSQQPHHHLDQALVKAASYGKTDAAKILLDHGADIHSNCDEALRMAAEFNHREMVIFLLHWKIESQGQANIHALNGLTLITCTSIGLVEMTGLLLAEGARIEDRDYKSLCVAVAKDHMGVADILITHLFRQGNWKDRTYRDLEICAGQIAKCLYDYRDLFIKPIVPERIEDTLLLIQRKAMVTRAFLQRRDSESLSLIQKNALEAVHL